MGSREIIKACCGEVVNLPSKPGKGKKFDLPKRITVKMVLVILGGMISGLFASHSVFGFADNQPASVVVGQPDMTSTTGNQGIGPMANTLLRPRSVFRVGSKLIIADSYNHRVLIYNSFPSGNNANADVVVGQADMISHSANQGGSPAANSLNLPFAVYSDGTKLFIVDSGNHRVLIYNSIPTINNANADVVVGQSKMTTNSSNQGGAGPTANTLSFPYGIWTDENKLFIAEASNNRVLIYNSIPTANNASANIVIGQVDMFSNLFSATAANTLNVPEGICVAGTRLFIGDRDNNRVLIFNPIPTANNASASVVIGQVDITSNGANQGGNVSANTLSSPGGVYSDGTSVYIGDISNNRCLIYNSIPLTNNAGADTVLGQPNLTSGLANQGGVPDADTLFRPVKIYFDGTRLIIPDSENHRILIYNPPPLTPTNTPSFTPTASPTSTATPIFTVTPIISVTFSPTGSPTIISPTITSMLTPYTIGKDEVIAYPSPARGNDLWFYYNVEGPTLVKIEIYNIRGEKAAVLSDRQTESGFHRTHWDIHDAAPGIYMYKMRTESSQGIKKYALRKLVIIK
jgi:hypothetical protein